MAIRYLSEPPASAELVIVGGGVVGCATAFHAARAGLHPLIVEARPLLATLTTPASTGAFRLQFDNQEELELVRESVELFTHFADVTGQREYDLAIIRNGYLFATTERSSIERQKRMVEALHGWGQTDVELLDGDEARRRFPYLDPSVVSARFRAGDGFLDPKALALGLACGAGAEVVTSCPATGFRESGGRLTAVQTSLGEIACEAAVIAAGPFSGPVAGLAEIRLPVVTVVRHKLIFPALELIPPGAPMTIDEDTGAHWRPALQGAYVLFTDPETPASPAAWSIAPDPTFAFQVLDPGSAVSLARIVPFWRTVWERNASTWLLQAGQYTVTPDHRPLIGPTPLEGLWVNAGYSGHGIMGSTAGSRLLADLLTGTQSQAENPFHVDRPFLPRVRDIL